jgi:hypothetical protein
MATQVVESPVSIREPRADGAREREEEEIRSLPQLLRDLSRDSVHLITQEVQLFRVETEQKLTRAQRYAIVLGAGGLVAFIGFVALVASLILVLALAIPAWISALVVGALMVVIGALALIMGKNRLAREQLAPRETVRSVKHDVDTVREAIR